MSHWTRGKDQPQTSSHGFYKTHNQAPTTTLGKKDKGAPYILGEGCQEGHEQENNNIMRK